MKRTKFILWVVVAAMVLMGAGYAAWTQTFTINSSVQTGQLYVKVDEVNDTDNIISIVESADKNDVKVDFDITGMFPGKEVRSVLRFTNAGTMQVVLKFNRGNYPEGSVLWEDLVIYVNDQEVKSAGETTIEDVGKAIASAIGAIGVGNSKDITIIQKLDLSSGNNTENTGIEWSLDFVFEQYNAQ